jgi:hypothetical protein
VSHVYTGIADTLQIIITTKEYYKTAYTLAHLLGYKSLDHYVSHIVVQNLEMEVTGGGDLELMLSIGRHCFDDYNYNGIKIISTTKDKGDNYDILPYYYCYWLCNRKAELKVYTDFRNVLQLCKMCYR